MKRHVLSNQQFDNAALPYSCAVPGSRALFDAKGYFDGNLMFRQYDLIESKVLNSFFEDLQL